MTPASQKKVAAQVLNQAARADFRMFQALMHPIVCPDPYIDPPHLRAIAHKLQQVATGEIKRLCIAVAPRHFKSYQTSVALPAFMLGLNPAIKVVCASYGAELSDHFAKQSREILRSDRYRAIFPKTALSTNNPPIHDIRTTGAGYRYTTSIGGALTGRGADLLILDDPIKASDASSAVSREAAYQWLKSTAMTRLEKPAEGAVIVVMQRLHQDDVLGRLEAEGGWDMLVLPAQMPSGMTIETGGGISVSFNAGDILFPQRFNAQVLAERRHELGDAAYNAQYLQRPTPPGGHLFKMAGFKRFDLPINNAKSQYEKLILSLDPGVSSDPKADYSALTIWGVRGPDLYLLAVRRGNWTFAQQLEQLREWRPRLDVLQIERSHSGILLMQTLEKESNKGATLLGFTPKLDKLVRAEAAALMVEQGHVFLPETAPWLAAYEQELAAFPHGTHDDQVDSTSQLMFMLKNGVPGGIKLSAFKPAGLVTLA